MAHEDGFKLLGMLIVGAFTVYIVIQLFALQSNVIEGLTNGADASGTTPASKPSSAAASGTLSGEAGTAESYAAAVKARVIKLQDELLIPKYRKTYEDVIIQMDDYVGLLTLKQVLNMNLQTTNPKAALEAVQTLNALKAAKESLNVAMKVVDSQ